jgi:hypothetical protein
VIISFLAFVAIFLYPHNAYAYLDPGTGSIILQSIIGALLVGTYTIKLYWYKIKSFFSSTEKEDDNLDDKE